MTESHSEINQLNEHFTIAGLAQVVLGFGELAKVHVTSPLGSADIYLHGAQVTSWRPAGAREVLFLSERSRWQAGNAIRGGIPICFPWFRAKADNSNAPAHGFVRTRVWNLDAIEANVDTSVTVTLSTASDQASRSWWPHEFHLVHRITVGDRLQLELIVTNVGPSSFRFEEALHTYFLVSDARQMRVAGLDQARYFDNTDGNREKVQIGDVTFNAATDRAFIHTEGELELIDAGLKRTLITEKKNSDTTVVWNPWHQGAAALSDLGDDEWTRMACVEASNIMASAIELASGESHTMRATIGVIPPEINVHVIATGTRPPS